MAHSRTGNDKRGLVARERGLRALQLRKAGMSFSEIAEDMSCSVTSAWKCIMHQVQTLNKHLKEEAEIVRRIESERLNELQAALWPKCQTGDVEAIHCVLRVMRRRASMLGLDEPAAISVTQHADEGFYSESSSVVGRARAFLRSIENAAADDMPPPPEIAPPEPL